MVWTAISTKAHTDLMVVENGALKAHRYAGGILQEAVILFYWRWLYVRSHSARVVSECLEEVGIYRIDWRPCSPDLNSIEHLCDQLQRRPVV